MVTPIVTVVLPVYNGEKYVLRAISSIQNQTIANWELVILDDGSSDRSLSICQECAEQDNRIKLYKNINNLGLSKTMNRLVYLAQGKYIAIQEQDDISLPDRLEKEVNFLESHPEVGLVSGIAAALNDDQEIYRYLNDEIVKECLFPKTINDIITYLYLYGIKISNPTCMFLRSILKRLPIPFDEEAKIPDTQFFLHIAHRYVIAFIPEILILFQRGQFHNSLSSNHLLTSNEDIRCLKKIYYEYKGDSKSPINYSLFRKAMSNHLLHYSLRLEGRNKLLKIWLAIYYYPLNYRAWKIIIGLILIKLKGLPLISNLWV